MFAEFPAGGTGATAGADGNNTVRSFAEGDISSIQPIESVELTSPLRIERLEIRRDSGGAGEQRGGLGLRRDIRLLGPRARLSVLSDKNVIPPYGVRAGHSSTPNRFTVLRGNREIQPSPLPGKITGFPLHRNDVLIMRTAGGGGYGDPLLRDPEAVARDLAYGYVSPSRARQLYGVVIRNGELDEQATERLRQEHEVARWCVSLVASADAAPTNGRRVAALNPAFARRAAIQDGDLIDIPQLDGPSLRAWVRLDEQVPETGCGLDEEGLSILGAAAGQRVEIRLFGRDNA